MYSEKVNYLGKTKWRSSVLIKILVILLLPVFFFWSFMPADSEVPFLPCTAVTVSFFNSNVLRIGERLPKFTPFEAYSTPYRIHFMILYSSIKPRYLCAVENLLRLVTENRLGRTAVELNVWIENKESLDNPSVKYILDSFEKTLSSSKRPNQVTIKFWPVSYEQIFQDTPFEEFYSCVNNEETICKPLGKYENQNKGNAARLAIVYKYGGLYLDLDFLAFEDPSLETSIFFKDGLAHQNKVQTNNAIFKFTKTRRKLLWKVMELFIEKYNGDRWGTQGPMLFTRFFPWGNGNFCMEEADQSQFICNLDTLLFGEPEDDLYVFSWPEKSVYPVKGGNYSLVFFQPYSAFKKEFNVEELQFVHLWHSGVKKYANKFCRETSKDMEKRYKKYSETSVGSFQREICPAVFSQLKESAIERCDF
eukprot:snap_masked-scaffold_3-processed-gene-3.55-mRNA-1 protein AED:1.00 eAED:1.00 QI:0/-1/0/0/-1/1/1/0/419